MEENDELLIKAIQQALASVALEYDEITEVEKVQIEKHKSLILRGNKDGRMGRLCYW